MRDLGSEGSYLIKLASRDKTVFRVRLGGKRGS